MPAGKSGVAPRSPTSGDLAGGVDLSERYADGLVSRDEWWGGTRGRFHFSPWRGDDAWSEACSTVEAAAGVAAWHRGSHFDVNRESDELRHLAAVLRCILGNPFRLIPRIEPKWLTHAVVTLAQQIYADRAFDRLPILADALQDAGCENTDILDHCRGPGPHVRGCWVVDLVLGKD